MRKTIFLLSLFFHVYNVFPSYEMNGNCINAYKDIFRLRFTEGKKLLDNEKKNNPQNLIPYYLENYIDFLSAIIGEEKYAYDNFKNNLPERIKKLESGDKSSPYYKYCLAEVSVQWAITKIKFNEYLSGLFELNKAYRLLESNRKEFPNFPLNSKSYGLLNVLISNIHENYKWIKAISPYDVSVLKGMNEILGIIKLSDNIEDHGYIKDECLFIYTYLKLNFSNENDNIEELTVFYNDTDFEPEMNSNPLLQYAYAITLMNSGNNDKAIEVLNAINTDELSFPFYYIDYLKASAKLERIDDDAYRYLFRFLQNFRGMYYIKSAYQKLAWYYLISGNTAKYNEYILKILQHGTAIIEEDKQAQYEAISETVPNVRLLKARLLFDGSYYSRALDTILKINPATDLLNIKDSVEYTYRLARIKHSAGRIGDAMKLYQETIDRGKDQKYYYAANSALKLAQIYEQEKQYHEAHYFYNRCLKFNYNEYRNSITREAKAGLSRIKQ